LSPGYGQGVLLATPGVTVIVASNLGSDQNELRKLSNNSSWTPDRQSIRCAPGTIRLHASRPGGGLAHRPTALSDVDRFGFTLRNCSHCLTSQSGLSPWTMTRASQSIRLSTKTSRTFSGLHERAGRMVVTPFLQSTLAIWTASAWSFSSALTKTS